MNIKEIALNVAKKMRESVYPNPYISEAAAIDFAEALVAELAKENEPVGYLWKWNDGILDDDHPKSGWNYSLEYPDVHPSNVNNIEIVKAFTLPPTAEQISELTQQRDLAVSAIENLVKQKGRHNTEIAYKKLAEALAAIKESENN